MTQNKDSKSSDVKPNRRAIKAAIVVVAVAAVVAAMLWVGPMIAPAQGANPVADAGSIDAGIPDGSHEVDDDLYCTDEPPVVDDWPTSEEAPAVSGFPTPEQLVMIGRIAKGMIKIKGKRDLGQWWECGELYDSDKAKWDAALEWAYRVVYLSWEYSDNGSEGGIEINPWGVVGVAYNESGFDRCALGTWPRRWAYENGSLKRRRRCISHTKEEIVKAMSSPAALKQWKKTGIDAAPLHELWKCEKDGCRPRFNRSLPKIGFDEVFSLGKGFEYNVRQMERRAKWNKTARPWLYWRGYKCQWYDDKVTRWARIMGAEKGEI